MTMMSMCWSSHERAKKDKENIVCTGLLSANLVSTDMLVLLDYFGSCSGNDMPKNDLAFVYEDGAILQVPTLSLSRWVYECEAINSVQLAGTTTFFCKTKNILILEKMQNADGLFGPI